MYRLTRLREAKGWTRSELARRAGMAGSTVGHIEAGRLRPYPSQLAKLARAFGVRVSEAHTLMDAVNEGAQTSLRRPEPRRRVGISNGQWTSADRADGSRPLRNSLRLVHRQLGGALDLETFGPDQIVRDAEKSNPRQLAHHVVGAEVDQRGSPALSRLNCRGDMRRS
jgi:transcriptional regulator with XRE-family HTH domain